MKIKREISGSVVEFELAPAELFDAYSEQRHLDDFDFADAALCDKRIFENMDDHDYHDAINTIAYEYRRIQGKYGMNVSEALMEAFHRYERSTEEAAVSHHRHPAGGGEEHGRQ